MFLGVKSTPLSPLHLFPDLLVLKARLYLFESNREEIVQCPDCGKLKVRPANKEEIKEFQDRVLEDDDE